ncbi:hybrid sensor histidine kinase/response regulator [Acuticoccus mangrovi]|uniref:histidine kinase n=1 Tax=Acuticoccus mangrovi TaxID=2796142 RepID=A0A934IH05_9HYPH|nr:PAS domain S-box protein [Acuticoccus mangrovi]MBJ3776298.1 PAS domain S-box protein [Acuticoccus mangrovi]
MTQRQGNPSEQDERAAKGDGETLNELIAQLEALTTRIEAMGGGGVDAIVGQSGSIYLGHAARSHFVQQANLLRPIFRSAATGMVLLDPQKAIVSANPAFCEMLRAPEDKVAGLAFLDLIMEAPGSEADPFAELNATRTTSRIFEALLRGLNGRFIATRISASADRDGDGEVLGYVAIVENITPQKLAEAERSRIAQLERAARQEAAIKGIQFNTLFEALPGLYFVCTSDLVVVGASDAFVEAIGVERGDFVGRELFDALPPEPFGYSPATAALLRTSLEKVRATGRPDPMPLQQRVIPGAAGEDGDTRYWEPLNSPVFGIGGKVEFIIHRADDITDTRRREEALERSVRAVSQSEERFRQLANALPQKVWVADAGGGLQFASHRLVNFIGEPNVLEHEQLFDGVVHPEEAEGFALLWSESLATGIPFATDFRMRRGSDGMYRWQHATAVPIRNEAGGVVEWYGTLNDVHDLKIAEANARRLAQQLDGTLRSITDGVITWDRAWRYTFVNAEAERLVRRNQDELLGHCLWDEFPELIGTELDYNFRRAVDEMASRRFTYASPVMRKWVTVSIFPFADGVTVIFRDVERERVREQRLRLLEAAVSQLNDIVLITEAYPLDPPGPRIVFLNEAFQANTGYTMAEAIGSTPRLLQGPGTNRAETRRIREALVRREPVRAELLNYKKGGDPFWLELDILPLFDTSGDVTHFVSVMRDVTSRKRQQSLMTWQAEMLDKSADAIIVRDTANVVTYWNRTAERVYGFSAEEAIGRHISDLIDHNPVALRAAMRETIETGHWVGRMDKYRKDGSVLTVQANWSLIPASDERDAAILTINTDISEKVRLEQQIAQSARLDSLGKLTGGIAHDLNNLLTIMVGSTDLLLKKAVDRPDLMTLLTMSRSAAERGSDLVQRLLSFARRQPLDPRPTDVNTLITNFEPLLRRAIGENIEVEIVMPGEVWLAEVDPGQLENAILNLCINARDAMQPDGGHLTIETSNVVLDEDYVNRTVEVEAGDYVLVSVTDTGHGMDAATLDRVFEPFFTTKSAGSSSGLGLSMVYGFVKQSGGHIAVYSEEGQGTSVRLFLPRSVSTSDPIDEPTRRGEIVGGDEVVLLVEDDDMVRDHATDLLKGLGYTVIAAESGPSAMIMLRDHPEVELLFTDVVMPGGMNGKQLAEAAREMRPDLPVLYTSGYTDHTIIAHGRLEPGVVLLSKPYRLADLASKLRQALEDGGTP